MPLLDTAPNPSAVSRLRERAAVPSALDTAGWENIALGLRERAFFSARVEDARLLSAIQKKLDHALSLPPEEAFASKSTFIADMRRFMGAPDGDTASLTDLSSSRRLGLLYEHNIEDAYSYARWKTENDNPAILDEFPAQEFLRVESRANPRDTWPERWATAGGQTHGGRMIARKDSPVWTALSRFGHPWPPFDFGSGMGVADVARAEAEALGVIPPGAKIAPQAADFNAKLEASLPDAAPAILADLKSTFGDQIDITGGKARWLADAISDFYRQAAADGPIPAKQRLDLGTATPSVIAAVKAEFGPGVDLTGWRMELDLERVRKTLKRHGKPGLFGPGTGEQQDDQLPIGETDIRAIPSVWRTASAAREGGKAYSGSKPLPGWPQSIRLNSSIHEKLWVVDFYMNARTKTLGLATLWRKK
jgi:hypothetical protein